MVETLEAIVADPSNLESLSDVRCGLYRLFLKLWNSVAVNHVTETAASSTEELGATRRIEAISIMPRVALLLTALEGFDINEVSRTLECSVEKAQSLLEAANVEIAAQISTDVLIIEDEPLIALDLQNVV